MLPPSVLHLPPVHVLGEGWACTGDLPPAAIKHDHLCQPVLAHTNAVSHVLRVCSW